MGDRCSVVVLTCLLVACGRLGYRAHEVDGGSVLDAPIEDVGSRMDAPPLVDGGSVMDASIEDAGSRMDAAGPVEDGGFLVPRTVDLVLTLGGTGADHVYGLAVGGDGNIAFGGHYGGEAALLGSTLPHAGGFDGFVGSLTPEGLLNWIQFFGGTGEDAVWDVASDGMGYVYAAASFSGTVGIGGRTITSTGPGDGVLIAVSPDGAVSWVRQFGGLGNGDKAFGVATDALGNVYMTGWLHGTFDFGAGPEASVAGSQDLIVVSYTRLGALRFARRYGGADTEQGQKIAVAAPGDIAVGGMFIGDLHLDGGTEVSRGSRDVLVLRFDDVGALVWHRNFGSGAADQAKAIAYGADGTLWLAGMFSGTVDFGAESPLVSAGDEDGFILGFEPGGSSSAYQLIGGSGDDGFLRLAPGLRGTMHVLGYFSGRSSFAGVPLVRRGGRDVFWAQLDPDGTVLASQVIGGGEWDIGRALATAPDGSVYIGGSFNGTADLGDGPTSSRGMADGFILRMTP